MSNEAELLEPALKTAMATWEKWKQGKTLLGSYPPGDEVLSPLAFAIERCDLFKPVSGKPIFSGYSGVGLTGSSLAASLLYRAGYGGIDSAIVGFRKVLTTKTAPGTYSVALWGLRPDAEIELADGATIMPYDKTPMTALKDRVEGLAMKNAGGLCWYSQRYFGTPGAVLTWTIPDFPYFGRPDKAFGLLANQDGHLKSLLALLQAVLTGEPIVGASWFAYADEDLDFNRHENHLIWCVPEVEPVVRSNVDVRAADVQRVAKALDPFPKEWRNKLVRSLERFVLSQCRHQPIDRAIDLVIAFEILTSGGKGDNSPPNWKVSVRTAQFIGGAPEARAGIRKSLGTLYQLRNEGSHGGDPNAAKAEATLGDCVGIYRTLVETLLAHGAPPDWYSFELEPRVRE